MLSCIVATQQKWSTGKTATGETKPLPFEAVKSHEYLALSPLSDDFFTPTLLLAESQIIRKLFIEHSVARNLKDKTEQALGTCFRLLAWA
jgi:hypothetical protein